MIRVALYSRVSTTDQDGGLETQLRALHERASARGWIVVGEFSDVGISGAKRDRPKLGEVMRLVRGRRINALIVTRLDRLARNLRHLIELAEELRQRNVDLVCLDQAIDTTTPQGQLMFHLLGAFAEFERALIRERIIAGVRRAQRHGTKSGKAIGRPTTKAFRRIDPDAATALLCQGLSLREVARRLGASHPTQIVRVVTNHRALVAAEGQQLVTV